MGNGVVRIGLVAVVVAAGSVVASPPPVAAEPPGCAPSVQDLGTYVEPEDATYDEVFGVVWPQAQQSPELDTDDDGTADAFTYTSASNRIDVVRGDGTASVVGLPPTISWTGSSSGHGDLDGDGRDDLWGTYQTQGTLGYGATIVIPGAIPAGTSNAADVVLSVRGKVIGDVTGDDRNDVMENAPHGPTFPGGPSGTHDIGVQSFVGALGTSPGPPAFPSDAPFHAISGDVDQDGQRDVLTMGRSGAPDVLHLTATGTDATFTVPVDHGRVVFYREAGRTYLLTSAIGPYIDGTTTIYRYRIDLGCPPPPVACPSPSIEAAGTFTAPGGNGAPGSAGEVLLQPITAPATDATFDMDGDGQADIVSHPTPNQTQIVRGDGTLTLDTAWDPSASSFADLDGDGRSDAWTSSRMGQVSTWNTTVLPGTAPVGDHALASVALTFNGRVVGDLDDDGSNDAALQSPSGPGVDLWYAFRPFTGALDPAEGPPAFAAGGPVIERRPDVDLDGRRDVVTATDDTHGTIRLSSSDVDLAFTSPFAFGTTYAIRDGADTYLVLRASSGQSPQARAAFRLRTGCARAWIGRAAPSLLGRPGTDADLGALDPEAEATDAQRLALTGTAYRSEEGRGHLVDQRFQQALSRDVDPVGRAYWVKALREGRRSPQNLSATLFGSSEFYRANGSTPDGWVTALYQRALGYDPDPTGAAYWKKQAATLGRERAAVRFLNAPGARRALVRAWYLSDDGLGRAVTPAELVAGEALLAHGGWDAFVVPTVADDAFYVVAQASHRLAS